MSGTVKPCELTATQALDALRNGRLSSRILVESCLEQIAARDGSVKAWARLRPDAALRDADRIDQASSAERSRLPLLGMPIGVKDIFCTADLETSAGSRILSDWLPAQDANAVSRLKQAGAILLGKTATTEFAFTDPAPTKNPLDLNHTPGGSSAGSAAAVAADMCLAALGTQTAGSILRPASYCGVVGFKPTYGAISLEGVLPLAWSMDHVGPITKTVADATLLFEQLIERNGPYRRPVKREIRIGTPDRYFDEAVPEVEVAMERIRMEIPALGWVQIPAVLPTSFEAAIAAASTVLQVESAAVHEDWFERWRESYGPQLRALVEGGQRIAATSYVRSQRVRRLAVQEMNALFQQIDVLLTPTTPAPAPKGFETTGDAKFCWPFSFFGMPTLTIPLPASNTHLPLGLQLAGPHGSDWSLLHVGQALERHIEALERR